MDKGLNITLARMWIEKSKRSHLMKSEASNGTCRDVKLDAIGEATSEPL